MASSSSEEDASASFAATPGRSGTREPKPLTLSWERSPGPAGMYALIAILVWVHVLVTVALMALLHWYAYGFSLLALAVVSTVVLLSVLPPLNDVGRDTVGKLLVSKSATYFPLKVHVEDVGAFDSKRKYIYACEPHCFLPLGIFAFTDLHGDSGLPRCMKGPAGSLRQLSSSAVQMLPIIRNIVHWIGVRSIDKASFRRTLRAGHSCAIIPGGAWEVMLSLIEGSPWRAAKDMIRQRKGFIKLAAEADAHVVPVVLFGGEGLYHMEQRFSSTPWIKRITSRLRFAPVFFWGRPIFHFGSGFFNPVPMQSPICTVVGKPIPCDGPGGVDAAHAAFIKAWEDLYERHRGGPMGKGADGGDGTAATASAENGESTNWPTAAPERQD